MNPGDPEKVYDLAVLGGGIAGCAVARDAALRGLSVILFERSTLGAGASSKSSKLIHGGLRYLELAWLDLKRLRPAGAFKNLRFVFSSLRETRVLARTAPGLVRPIRLFVPVYRGKSRGPLAIYLGTLLYGFLSRLAGHRASPRIFWGRRAALEAMPLLNPEGLAGAVEIADHTTDDLALVQAIGASARQNGAEIHEHAVVRGWKFDANPRVFHIDVVVGAIHESPLQKAFFARRIVNATGPWIDKTRGGGLPIAERYVFPVGGSHIELAAFVGRSVILEARDGRVFFVVEKNGRARVGTTEWPCENPDDARVPPGDSAYLLASLSRYFPSKAWGPSDVLSSDAGVRPLAADRSMDTATRLSREHAIRKDADGVFHLAGVKLTDHRRAAEKTVDRVVKSLGRKGPRSQTAVTPLCR